MINCETEYLALRKEIEARLFRETVYRAVQAIVNNREGIRGDLSKHIENNDKVLALIGKYLFKTGWEKYYSENKDQ